MTVDERIKKEQEKLSKLVAKRNELDEEIKSVQKNIKMLEDSRNAEKMGEMTKAISKLGIDFSDVMDALMKGDFLALQEQIESKQVIEEDEATEDKNGEAGESESTFSTSTF